MAMHLEGLPQRTAYLDPRVGSVRATFTISVRRGSGLTREHLMDMLAFAQELGFGPQRSRGFGRFNVMEFTRISPNGGDPDHE